MGKMMKIKGLEISYNHKERKKRRKKKKKKKRKEIQKLFSELKS